MAEPAPSAPPEPPARREWHPALVAAGALTAGAASIFLGYLAYRLVLAYWGWLLAVLVVAGIGAGGLLWARHQERREAERVRALAHLSVVDDMTGAEFEELVASLLRRDGHQAVQVVGRTGDRGVDVTATTPDGRRVAVQCKRQRKNVGADRVRNLIGAVHGFYRGHRGVLITNAYFTGPAREEQGDLLLIDRDALARWMDGDPLDL
ncbi:restriction endonuclease [Spirillospora sp. NPDC050679]